MVPNNPHTTKSPVEDYCVTHVCVSDSNSRPCLTGALTRGSVLGQSCVSSPSLEHGGFETRGGHCLGEEKGGGRERERREEGVVVEGWRKGGRENGREGRSGRRARIEEGTQLVIRMSVMLAWRSPHRVPT